MTGLLHLFFGYVRVQVAPDADGYAWILNLLHKENLPFWHWRQREADARFCLSRRDCARLGEQSDARERVSVLGEGGFLPCLMRYRWRMGLFAGILCLLLTVFASRLFLWEVRVEGNEVLDSTEIIADLESLGVGVGSYLPHLDGYQISKALLGRDHRIAWASVNLRGNVAHVSIRERAAPPQKESDTPANLVASEDGVVMYTTLSAGQSMIESGNAVRAGELLVSGIVENKNGTHTLCGASGAVYARVVRTLEEEISFLQGESVRAQAVFSQKSLLFFGKELNFLKKDGFFSENSGNLGAKYDTIKEEKNLCLFGRVVLPIRYVKTTVYRVEEQSYTLSEQEAQQRLIERMTVRLQELKTLSQSMTQGQVQLYTTETGMRAVCEVSCVLDIAVRQPIILVE